MFKIRWGMFAVNFCLYRYGLIVVSNGLIFVPNDNA